MRLNTTYLHVCSGDASVSLQEKYEHVFVLVLSIVVGDHSDSGSSRVEGGVLSVFGSDEYP